MRCPQCRLDNAEGRRFCAACGASLAQFCPGCQFANEPAARFCGGCGRPLGLAAGSGIGVGSGSAPPPAFLAAKIVQNRQALEGERKQVTVLFADLKGSMELLAGRDPEDARAVLDPVLERMIAAVHRFEGTVNQVMGDGIMALFGAPVAHEDHAVRAGYAALSIQEAIRALGEQTAHASDVPYHVRVGLNAGEVVVKEIGNDLTMDYTAVGETTHLAARMEQLANPGAIFVTEPFVRLTEGYLQFKPLGLVAVKGLTEPIEVFELVDAEPTRGRFQGAARGLARFVGRRPELDALERSLQRVRSGQGQAVAVIGDAGVGKSRLFYEFLELPSTRDCMILEASAVSYGKMSALQPFRELVRSFFQIDTRDDAGEIHRKVGEKLARLDESLVAIAPAMIALQGTAVEDRDWHTVDPLQRRQRMLDGLKRLFIRLSQAQPLILMIENLHWIDGDTQALLDSLVDSLPAARVLLLVNYRPEFQHGWGSKTYYVQLRLDPLSIDSCDELLRNLLGDAPELQPVKRLLLERTEGNPFFLEESIRNLVDSNVLTGRRGACRLAKAPATIQVPATVQAVLAARIDRLSPDDKRVLQCAAVIGKDMSFAILQALVGMPETDLRQRLGNLQAAEFLYEKSLFPDLEYTFKHALTQDVAYGTLLTDRRRELHASVVHAIETLQRDRLANEVDRLAYHAFRGALWEAAVAYARQAGAKAARNSAYREAAAWLEQGLEALARLPQRNETLAHAVELRLELRNMLLPLGEHQRILEHLAQAEKLATSLGDERRLGWVCANRARQMVLLGEPAAAVEAVSRALSLGEAHGDLPLEVTATSVLGQACYARGEYRRGAEVLRRNVAALTGERGQERLGLAGLPSVTSRTFLVFCLAELGEFADAHVLADEAVRMADAADHPYSIAHALFGAGHVALRQGNWSRAIALLER